MQRHASSSTRPSLLLLSALLAGAAFAVGCDSKPSEEACDKAADKYHELLKAEQGDEGPMAEMNQEMRDGIRSDCVKAGSKKWIECVEKASTVADVEGCEK